MLKSIRTGKIIFALGEHCENWRKDERDQNCQKGREGLRNRSKEAEKGHDRDDRGDEHGPEPDRVDAIKMRSLELDIRGTQFEQRLINYKVRYDRPDPGDSDVGIEAKYRVQKSEYAEFHQEQGDTNVKKQPDDSSRMPMQDAGKEVRPGKRT